MKTKVICSTIFMLASLLFTETFAQVGISSDNSTPDNSTMLDVNSTSKW